MSKLFVAADIMRDLARACDLDAISGPSVCQTLQSSTWTPDAGTQHYRDQGVRAVRGLNGSSMLAVDGSADNCSQTWREISPWWRVDLGAPRLVVSVRVYGRVDCCQGELEGFEIRVGNWPAWDKNAPCATNISAPRDPRWVEVSCLAEGRYVFVVVPGTNRSLALCEVQVHGLSNQDSNAITGIHPSCTACIPGLPKDACAPLGTKCAWHALHSVSGCIDACGGMMVAQVRTVLTAPQNAKHAQPASTAPSLRQPAARPVRTASRDTISQRAPRHRVMPAPGPGSQGRGRRRLIAR